MDGSLDSLESLLKSGLKQYAMDGVVYDELQKTVARLVRLRRDVVSDFHESMQEVEPLYHSLERDSILARGASRALEQIDKFGLRSLQLTDVLALPAGWLQQGLFTNTTIESYLLGVKEYVPQQAPHLSLGENVSNPQYMDLQNVVDNLNNEIPVTDTLAWLFDRYLDFELTDILRVYGHLIHSPLCETTFSHEQKNYQFNDVNICAFPMVIEQIL